MGAGGSRLSRRGQTPAVLCMPSWHAVDLYTGLGLSVAADVTCIHNVRTDEMIRRKSTTLRLENIEIQRRNCCVQECVHDYEQSVLYLHTASEYL